LLSRQNSISRFLKLHLRTKKGGYNEGSPADLPAARREKYEASGRTSKVLVKQLA